MTDAHDFITNASRASVYTTKTTGLDLVEQFERALADMKRRVESFKPGPLIETISQAEYDALKEHFANTVTQLPPPSYEDQQFIRLTGIQIRIDP